ncbi:MAG TPA: hypothetical protein PKY30_26515 [Myxococcota bacterium]|nr:hypothetical protein [Myxococcota bacterium]
MILVNLGLNAALIGPLAHRGLALSTSIVASWSAAAIFWEPSATMRPLSGCLAR